MMINPVSDPNRYGHGNLQVVRETVQGGDDVRAAWGGGSGWCEHTVIGVLEIHNANE